MQNRLIPDGDTGSIDEPIPLTNQQVEQAGMRRRATPGGFVCRQWGWKTVVSLNEARWFSAMLCADRCFNVVRMGNRRCATEGCVAWRTGAISIDSRQRCSRILTGRVDSGFVKVWAMAVNEKSGLEEIRSSPGPFFQNLTVRKNSSCEN